MRSRATGLLLGALADAVLGDPRRGHPVAAFGAVAAALERRVHADRRLAGAGYTAVLVGGAVGLGIAAEAAGRGRPVLGAGLTALATWTVLGGSSLAGHGAALAGELDAGDLTAARRRVPSLCGRDPESLDAAGMARAGVESLAENTSDAVVAPLFWGAVAGVPGLLGYRAVNTLDAMVGYRSSRYRRFGWASARLDDVANLVPARVCAALFAVLAPAVGGSPSVALAAWRRDAGGHPSPNAGPVEAAAAGALGVGLGGRTVYAHGVEERPRLGSGPPPAPADLHRAARLSRLVGAAAAVLAALSGAGAPRRRRRRRPGRGAGRCGRASRGAAAARGG
ncbi:cobalamin biosynthesis protein [Pseudonocardia petroleophila]|uniref:Cobalamin biosynthesis protein CobD n=1 Tax=Pseudonocardia petroleophila TaxID=37331 RepID=A0A7G7MBA0_9PSEU|nr:cobalamin biosynthesis protein [Pseudonocardia petroleophila]QNG50061.1 cobalamin biosynthesis protein [Pseudonocardia petroleophila]